MLLTVDIGNSTVCVTGLTRRDGDFAVAFSAKLDTVREQSETEYHARLAALLERQGAKPEALEGTALCSVVPCLDARLCAALRAMTGREPFQLTHGSKTGLTFAVPEPERVGLDRIADAAWAANVLPLPAVTVDMGTATTFSVVDAGGVFCGGAIAPGLETGLRALSARAAQLPELSVSAPECVIGQTTEDCMCIGAVTGAAAMIDGLTARMEETLGASASLLLTGELARCVSPLCRHPHIYEPHLLAEGLALLYTKNR